MYKKGMLVFAAVLLAAAIVGCQCNGNMTNPSPSPLQTARPTATMSPDVSTSPDLSASPGVSGSPNPDTSPNGTDAAVIPDFEEGKEVEADTVPEIVEAVKAEFANGEIQSIKHATQDDRQRDRVRPAGWHARGEQRRGQRHGRHERLNGVTGECPQNKKTA